MERREVPFQNLKTTNQPLMKELEEAAARVIRSGWYLHGSETEQLEQELSSICGGAETVAVSNGLDAIRLMMRAQMDMGRLEKGDEILVPGNTFIASVLPITELGLKPVMVEPSEKTFNIDFEDARRKVGKRTRGLLAVHLYGTPAWDEKAIEEFVSSGILIMEDNAQAIGASIEGKGLNGVGNTGNLGNCGAISFYPGKNIGALGDAGAVTTSDHELASHIRMLANYGSSRRYYSDAAGYNNRMDEIQAAFLRVKLRHIEVINGERTKMARLYSELIANPEIRLPEIFQDRKQVWHQYVIRCSRRDELQKYLAEKGIGTLVHYPVPPHLQKCYDGKLAEGGLPVTELMADEVLSLPIANVSAEDVEYVSRIINEF